MSRGTLLIACLAAAAALGGTAAAADLKACLGAAIPTVLTPENSLFPPNAALRNWQGRHDDRKPAAVSFPGTPAQVAAAMRCAEAAGVPFVARSGGHSYEAASVQQGAVVIDLSNMTQATWVTTPGGSSSMPPAVAAERSAASASAATPSAAGAKAGVLEVGPGTRLGVVYDRLGREGLMFPGGTCPGVGVSGFLLGGGQGHSVRKLGLGADSVLGATVVTAAGKVLEANATHNADLFWALRGGGASYGIVTAWRLQAYHPPPVATVALLDAPLSVPRLQWLLDAFMAWRPWTLPGDFASIDLRIEGDSCGIKLVFWGSADALKQQLDGVPVFRDAPRAIGGRVSYTQEPFTRLILDWTKASGQLPASAPWDKQRMAAFQTPAKLDPVSGYRSYRFSGGLDFAGAGFLLQRPVPTNLSRALADVVVPHHLALHRAGHLAVAYLTCWSAQVAAPPLDFNGFGWRRALVNFQVGTPMRQGNAADASYARRVQQQLLPLSEGAMFYNYFSCLAGDDPYTRGNKWRAFFGPAADRLQSVKRAYDPRDRFRYSMDCQRQ